jgi:hypothetical protein
MPLRFAERYGVRSDFAEDRLRMVAPRIEHEGGIVARWVSSAVSPLSVNLGGRGAASVRYFEAQFLISECRQHRSSG